MIGIYVKYTNEVPLWFTKCDISYYYIYKTSLITFVESIVNLCEKTKQMIYFSIALGNIAYNIYEFYV